MSTPKGAVLTNPLDPLIDETLERVGGADVGSSRVVFYGERTWVLEDDPHGYGAVAVWRVEGDVEDLIGAPLLVAEETRSTTVPGGTETLYTLATRNGVVEILWFGYRSNYAEAPRFREL